MKQECTLLRLPLQFPFEQYGYRLDKVLNNKNRWDKKIVSSVWDENLRRYVFTTYKQRSDYQEFIKTSALLKNNNKIAPKIYKVYPEHNTVSCEHIGEFLSEYMLSNPENLALVLISVFEYLKDINSMNRQQGFFNIPSIVKSSLQLSKELMCGFELLPCSSSTLFRLEKSNMHFLYGYGIEDPYIWNFRINKTPGKIQAFTTDLDYFTETENCFWELGYFYSSFRWFKKISAPLACEAERILLSFIEDTDLESEFMFWLGALSSYCGYKDSMLDCVIKGNNIQLKKEYQTIQHLDKKVAYLADKLLLAR